MSFISTVLLSLCQHQILLVSFHEILGQGMSPFSGYSMEYLGIRDSKYEGRQNNVEKDILEKIS